MPARIRKVRHDQSTRDKIRTSQLVNRLTDHALGKVDLTNTQVRAIEVLLRKTLADLSAVTVKGDEDNPVQVEHAYRDEITNRIDRIAAKFRASGANGHANGSGVP